MRNLLIATVPLLAVAGSVSAAPVLPASIATPTAIQNDELLLVRHTKSGGASMYHGQQSETRKPKKKKKPQ